MITRRRIWISVSIFHLIFFFFIIPIDVYAKSNLLLSSIGAILFFACLFQVFANFETPYDLFEKSDPDEPKMPGRKLAPLAILPAIILLFALIFYHSERKNRELEINGMLTQGIVVTDESASSTEKFQANASYNVIVSYTDSLDCKHTIEETVDDALFNDLTEGSAVNVVYSSEYPTLARIVLEKEELSKFIERSEENLSISHLIKILDGKVKEDSILAYLNSINYEWISTSEKGYYQNDVLNMVIKLASNNDHMVFVRKSNALVSQNHSFSFEGDISDHGFKKKTSNVQGEIKELYHNDKYVIKKEWQQLGNNGSSNTGYDIYYIGRVENAQD